MRGAEHRGDALRRAAFIDRDGVINEERSFVFRPEDFVLLPGAIEGLRALQHAGFLLVVITNQSGIARGLYRDEDYQSLTTHMQSELRARGVRLDAIEYCPHLPDAPLPQYRRACECRKPRPGMLRRAAATLGIDLPHSVLIGDRATDVAAGRAAGIGRCLLVRSGYPISAQDAASADAVFDDLAACARDLLAT